MASDSEVGPTEKKIHTVAGWRSEVMGLQIAVNLAIAHFFRHHKASFKHEGGLENPKRLSPTPPPPLVFR